MARRFQMGNKILLDNRLFILASLAMHLEKPRPVTCAGSGVDYRLVQAGSRCARVSTIFEEVGDAMSFVSVSL